MEGGGGTSSNPMRMALLSPEAPEEVASAASEKIVTFRLRPAVSCITSHCSRVKRGWSAGMSLSVQSVAREREGGTGRRAVACAMHSGREMSSAWKMKRLSHISFPIRRASARAAAWSPSARCMHRPSMPCNEEGGIGSSRVGGRTWTSTLVCSAGTSVKALPISTPATSPEPAETPAPPWCQPALPSNSASIASHILPP